MEAMGVSTIAAEVARLRAAYAAMDRHLRDKHGVEANGSRAHLDGAHQQAHAREGTRFHLEVGGMRIYMAGRYSRRLELMECRRQLAGLGFVTTSRWLNGNHQISDRGADPSAATRFAEEDLEDVRAAHLLIAFTEEPRATASRGGRHVELGVALGAGIPAWIVGPAENVFCWLPTVTRFDRWDDALSKLAVEHTADKALAVANAGAEKAEFSCP